MKSSFKCPLCRGASYRHLYSAKDRMFEINGTFTVVRCRSCSLVSLYPMPSQAQVSPHYPTERYYAYAKQGKDSFFSRLRRYLIRREHHPGILTKLLPKVPAIPGAVRGGKILDVGCGRGDTLVLLGELGWETYGIDIDAKAVAIAKKRGVDNVRVGFYQDVAMYPDNFFDAIRLYHVIEHLDDPMKCLTIIRRKLKRGGEVIIGTPNVESLLSHIFETYWYNLDAPRHLVLFSPLTLKRAVIDSGLSSPHIEFCSAGGFLGSIQYVLRKKFVIRWNLIHAQWLVVFLYPLEWLVDKMKKGDVFVLRATK